MSRTHRDENARPTNAPGGYRVRVEVVGVPGVGLDAPFEVELDFVRGRRNALVAREASDALLRAVDAGREMPLGVDCVLVTPDGAGVAACGAPSRWVHGQGWKDVRFVRAVPGPRGPWERLVRRVQRVEVAPGLVFAGFGDPDEDPLEDAAQEIESAANAVAHENYELERKEMMPDGE